MQTFAMLEQQHVTLKEKCHQVSCENSLIQLSQNTKHMLKTKSVN